MKFIVVIFFLFCAATCVQVHSIEELIKNNFSDLWGAQQQEDHWNWGYVVLTQPIKNQTVDETTSKPLVPNNITNRTPNEPNPCDLEENKKPDFTAPGRRISETKCYEYMWELKNRAEEVEKNRKCWDYRREHDIHLPSYAIGGRVTFPGEFPHMGAIGWRSATDDSWIFKCGSSLISPNFILTAAHCSRASSRDTTIADPIPKIVRLGDKNILDSAAPPYGVDPEDAKIINIVVHPQYKPPKKYYDIALMELEIPVIFTKYVQPACLWGNADTSTLGTKATLTGWGVVDVRSIFISPELQAADVDVINSDKCDGLLRSSCNRHWCGIKDHQLCAGKLTGGVDACQGDSGGPLQVKIPLPITSEGNMHFVIGVTSFGIGCALENLPGIYTRVSSFIDWIENIVWR